MAAVPDATVQLQLQVIPYPSAGVMAKPVLMADGVIIHVVAGWPVHMEYSEGRNSISGPVPHLFQEQPEEMRTYIEGHLEDFHKQLNKFSSR